MVHVRGGQSQGKGKSFHAPLYFFLLLFLLLRCSLGDPAGHNEQQQLRDSLIELNTGLLKRSSQSVSATEEEKKREGSGRDDNKAARG